MTARNAALQTLVRIDSEQAFSNIQVNKIIEEQKLDSKDKNLYVNLVYGTLQHKLTLDYVLKQFIHKGFDDLNPKLVWALRIAAYQILFLTKTPDYAVVNETVNQIKKIDPSKAKFANAVLRNLIREKKSIEQKIQDLKNPELKYSVPKWIQNKYQETFGDEAEEILADINNNPILTLRVKPDYLEKVYSSLDKLGAEPQYSTNELIKDSTILVKKPSAVTKGIKNSKAFKSGLVTMQDQGAIEIGKVLDPEKGDLILDMCAAPGGKTCHIADLMDNEGQIIACDIHENRLDLINRTAKRLGSDSVIDTKLLDGTIYNPEFKEKFDKILVDAPCSGLGIIKRKPDIRYRVTREDVRDLNKIQKKILENAFNYLKPGGKLVYSTCTVGNTENEDVVESVQELFPDNYEVVSQNHTNPLEDGGDAFYYAVIEKKEND